jgi:hypothetical protein
MLGISTPEIISPPPPFFWVTTLCWRIVHTKFRLKTDRLILVRNDGFSPEGYGWKSYYELESVIVSPLPLPSEQRTHARQRWRHLRITPRFCPSFCIPSSPPPLPPRSWFPSLVHGMHFRLAEEFHVSNLFDDDLLSLFLVFFPEHP